MARFKTHTVHKGAEEAKSCSQCKQDLKVKDFYPNNRNSDGLGGVCKSCIAENARKRHYGIDPQEYARLLIKQSGRCAICKSTSNDLMVDHCHSSGITRGLLCRSCNFLIGACQDQLSILDAAENYLILWDAEIFVATGKGFIDWEKKV